MTSNLHIVSNFSWADAAATGELRPASLNIAATADLYVHVTSESGTVEAKGLPRENTLHGHPCPQARSIYCAVCPLSVDQARGALTPTMETPLANDW